MKRLLILLAAVCLYSCAEKNEVPAPPELTVGKTKLAFERSAGSQKLDFKTNRQWTITSSESWCTVSPAAGEAGAFSVDVSVAENATINPREAVLTIAASKLSKKVTVTQTGTTFTIPADKTGVESDAAVLAAKMTVGWNSGNSLEACSGVNSASETSWGNPPISKTLIDAVKAAGFNAIRIPCAWSGYIENRETHKIRSSWLARVKEVVDLVVGNDMYAIINIHWDGGWLEENPTYAKQVEVNAKQKALWEQIAVYFRDYDERLLFAGTNEVHANYNTPTVEHRTVQMSYNQTFVDAVRSTGGRNAWRNLVIQAYNTNINHAVAYLQMPTDSVPNRLMAEVHYYDPWDFCGEENNYKYLWGAEFAGNPNVSTWGQEAYADAQFDKMKINFVDRGIPVILGEYSATYRATLSGQALADHRKSRNNFLYHITKSAIARGLIPFYWDNGATGNNGSGLFDRTTGAQVHAEAVQAIISGAN